LRQRSICLPATIHRLCLRLFHLQPSPTCSHSPVCACYSSRAFPFNSTYVSRNGRTPACSLLPFSGSHANAFIHEKKKTHTLYFFPLPFAAHTHDIHTTTHTHTSMPAAHCLIHTHTTHTHHTHYMPYTAPPACTFNNTTAYTAPFCCMPHTSPAFPSFINYTTTPHTPLRLH